MGAGGRGTRRMPVSYRRGVLGPPVGAQQGRGECAGRGEQPRIEANRAGYACKVSRVDAWTLQKDGCACGVGIKSAHRGRLRGCLYASSRQTSEHWWLRFKITPGTHGPSQCTMMEAGCHAATIIVRTLLNLFLGHDLDSRINFSFGTRSISRILPA